jgi:hypothetical protein
MDSFEAVTNSVLNTMVDDIIEKGEIDIKIIEDLGRARDIYENNIFSPIIRVAKISPESFLLIKKIEPKISQIMRTGK